MSQRLALLAAAALTAFVLIVIGGIGTRITAQSKTQATPTEVTTEVALTSDPGLDPTAVQALLDQRQATYQQSIQQANQQLQQMKDQLQQSHQKQEDLAHQLQQSYQQ